MENNELVDEVREQEIESDEQVQKRVRRLVNKFRDTRDVTTFSKLSYDESYVVSKYYLIHELIKIGKPAVPAVAELLEEKNHLLRELAVKTLAEIGDHTTVPCIIKSLEDEKRRVRSAALAALKRLTKMSFGSYAKRNQSHENQEQVIRKWQSWWDENESRSWRPPNPSTTTSKSKISFLLAQINGQKIFARFYFVMRKSVIG